LIKQGNFTSTAAQFVGIDQDTVFLWIKRGECGEPPFKAFAEDYRKAKAQPQIMCVNTIAKAIASGDAPTAFKLLAKRYAKQWGDENKHSFELSGPQGAPIETKTETVDSLDYGLLTVEELRTLKALRAKMKGKA